jgi:hypothetical protein
MSTFSNSYFFKCCSRRLLRGESSTRRRSGGAGSRLLCSIHIGPSCTTCAVPAQNGERSTRTAMNLSS